MIDYKAICDLTKRMHRADHLLRFFTECKQIQINHNNGWEVLSIPELEIQIKDLASKFLNQYKADLEEEIKELVK